MRRSVLRYFTRLISRDVLSEIVEAWSRLEDGVRKVNGELVVSDSREVEYQHSGTMVGRTPQREQKASPRDGTAEITSRENVRLDISVDARDRGLVETLGETFPCSDALSSIPGSSGGRRRLAVSHRATCRKKCI